MGILDRVSRLVRANVNDALDHAEDPEKMLDQLIRDMDVEIRQARAQVATMIAQEKELAADKAEADRLTAEWQRRAEMAVAQGKDDLAREALRRKHDSEENARVYGEQLTAQQQTVSRLKTQLQELENKYQSMQSRRDALIARSRRAQAQQRVSETMSNLPAGNSSAEFERFERRIRSSEAQAAASQEVAEVGFDDEFAELERDHGVEDELAALKAQQSGGALPAGSPGTGGSVDDELAALKAQRAGSQGTGDTAGMGDTSYTPPATTTKPENQ